MVNLDAYTMAQTLLNLDAENPVLTIIAATCEKEALAYTKNDAILFETELLAKMIVVAYRTRGNEGLSSQSLATVSESYLSDYPETIYIALRGFRKLKSL